MILRTVRPVLIASIVAGLLFTGAASFARRKPKGLIEEVQHAIAVNHSYVVPAAGNIEVAFSPDEGSEALVLKVINSAHREVRVLSYSFTSAPVAQALLQARKRGVDVKLVADEKNNVSEDHSGKARAALSALADAGADVRVIKVYPIHHDKVVVIDADTVELGSFNFSDAAAHRNSENVLVNWHNPQLAKVYLEHFARNYRDSTPYQLRY